jgi:hypothetical protein
VGEIVQLRLVAEDVPPATIDGRPAEFGLQNRRGELFPGTPQENNALAFIVSVTIGQPVEGRPLDVAGPFVHGTPGGRFLYLSYREAGASAWVRRTKVPLTGLAWEQIEAALQPEMELVGRVSVARTGTVRLLGDGWLVQRRPIA